MLPEFPEQFFPLWKQEKNISDFFLKELFFFQIFWFFSRKNIMPFFFASFS